MPEDNHAKPVEDFAAHVSSMQEFHQRYMGSNQACRLWVNMVRKLDMEMMIQQHGRPFIGKEIINDFLDWFSELECGMDLIDQSNYQIP